MRVGSDSRIRASGSNARDGWLAGSEAGASFIQFASLARYRVCWARAHVVGVGVVVSQAIDAADVVVVMMEAALASRPCADLILLKVGHVGAPRAMEVDIEPTAIATVPDPGLLRLQRVELALSVNRLGDLYVGDGGCIVSEQVDVRVDDADVLVRS